MNKVIICGNLGNDPELREVAGDTKVTELRVAVNERIGKGDDAKEHTEWFSVKAFGRQAETSVAHLKKGSKVLIEGRQRTHKYTDKEGVEKYRTEVIAQRVQFV